MGTYKNKTYPLRIDNELMDKVRKIAELEDRKISDQLTRIIKEYVIRYELENGSLDDTIIALSKANEQIIQHALKLNPNDLISAPVFANKLTKKYEESIKQ